VRAGPKREYLDYWLTEVARPGVRPTTYAKYEVVIRLYLKPGLGQHRLDRLSVATVQFYLNGACRRGTRPPRFMSSGWSWARRLPAPCEKS